MLLELLGLKFNENSNQYDSNKLYANYNSFEHIVSAVLSRSYKKPDYYVLNDVLIRTKKRSVQIDHILLSKYGIFVIESKDYKGSIYGNKKSNYYTQYIWKKESKFQNPAHQNYAHIKILSDIFDIPEEKFISIVCFNSTAKLKTNDDNVVLLDNLLHKIDSYNKIIINDNLELIAKKLEAFNVKDYIGRKEHVNDVKEKIERKQEKIESRLCPRCHGNLLLHHGKYGDFLGCSNYPNCHFKERVE